MENVFKQSKCIGILGGTFNPVHNGHILLAKTAINCFDDMEHFIFLPNNKPAYKDNNEIADARHRVKMLELATSSIDNINVSTLEIDRGGMTYTIDTLEEIKAVNPNIKIYFVIGDDSLYSFNKWVRYQDILRHITLVVARRTYDYDALKAKAEEIISSHGYGDIKIMEAPIYEAASSEIRKSIAQGTKIDVIDNKVYDYIVENNLYGYC